MNSPYPQYPQNTIQEFPNGQEVHYLDFASAEVNISSLGSFPHATDYFNDGSYLIDARGHSPGHIVALARTGLNSYF